MGIISNFLSAFDGKFSVFKKHPPIETAEDFGDFLASRASFIAQKTLYGYLKTRMGMQFPKMFDDDVFVESINVAKWQIYAACLSDLALFMAARFHKEGETVAHDMALHWFSWSIEERFEKGEFDDDTAPILADFKERLEKVDWTTAAIGEGAFQTSPDALIRFAPIDDKLKAFDEPLVRNSIRFQWQAIRRDYAKLLDETKVLADWQARG